MNNQKCREYLRAIYASDELQHGLLGSFFKKHKYIKREEMPPGSKTRYRYIYDEADQSSAALPKKTIADAIKGVFRSLSKVGEKVYDTTHKAKLAALQTVEKTHKYIAKLTSPTGKIRYFYDEKVMNRVKKMWAHWKNEAPIMSSAPKIAGTQDGDPPNLEQNIDAVNVGGRNSEKYRGINCAQCTIALELRNRGYDVTAPNKGNAVPTKEIMSWFGYNVKQGKSTVVVRADKSGLRKAGLLASVSTPFKKFSVVLSEADNAVRYKIKKTGHKYDDGSQGVEITSNCNSCDDPGYKQVIPCESDKDFIWNGSNTANKYKVAESLVKTIDEYPDSASGWIGITWEQGGGHAIYWAKDEKGSVKVIDAQVGKHGTVLYDSKGDGDTGLASYMGSVSPTSSIDIFRLDNRDVTDSDILKYIDY